MIVTNIANDLSSKFIVFIAIALILVIGSTNYLLYHNSVTTLQAARTQQAEAKIASLLSLSSHYISQYETELLVKLGEDSWSQGGIASIAILDIDGRPYFKKSAEDLSQSQAYSREILSNNKQVGTLKLAVDISDLNQQLKFAFWLSIALALLSIVALAGLLIIFFRSQVVHEMNHVRKQEALIREEYDFFSAVLDTSESFVIVTDAYGDIQLINCAAASAVGCTQDDASGQQVWDYLLHLDMDDERKNHLVRQLKTVIENTRKGQFPDQPLITFVNDEDCERAIKWVFSSLSDENGKVKHIICTGMDITQQFDEQQKLEHEVLHDGLTGIANRRYFDQFLRRSIEKHKMIHDHLSLVMIDIDYFKQYNDCYGHQVGDVCLKKVAAALAVGRREDNDLAARYGGEEFALLLRETDSQAAQVVAKRVRDRVDQLQIEHASSDISNHLTLSMGIATMTGTEDILPDELIARADAALYQAKQSGRNCTIVA